MKDPYKYFKIEAEEIVENLTKGLLALEKKPKDEDLIKDLLRHAHTLKGAANVVKLPRISQIAHKTEDMFALFIDQKKESTQKDVTLLLDAVTVIGEMVEALKDGRSENSVDTSIILDKLEGRTCFEPENFASGPDNSMSNKDFESGKMDDQNKISHKSKIEAADTSESTTTTGRRVSDQQQTLRIEASQIDLLTNLSNEILINHLRLKDLVENLRKMTKQSGKNEFFHKQLENTVNALEQGVDRTGAFSEEMNDKIMQTRLISVKSYTYLFERAVRDLAAETDKKIDFSIQGDNFLLDRSILEQIKEPIYHMLRNSVIHGMEPDWERKESGKETTGAIVLKFEKAGSFVQITCQDDGRGLDSEKIKAIAVEKNLIDPGIVSTISDKDAFYLILKSGFSSARRLTELSGRGVGLDVVKNRVLAQGGSLDIESEKGKFTRFTLTLPLSANIVDTLMVEVSGQNLMLPLKYVLKTELVEETEIATEAGKKVIPNNGSPVPLIPLADILSLTPKNNNKRLKTVFIKANVETVGLIVDDFKGIKSILLKPIEGQLKKIEYVSFSTILENGDPALVFNIDEIFNRIKKIPERETEQKPETSPPDILVVDDSLTTRTLIDGILKGEGYSVLLAHSGEEALGILEKDSIDLAIVDVEMPGMNGFELSQKIRQNHKDKDVPIVILSSLASDTDKRKGIEVGANAYIVKGAFDQETFLETVESFI